MDKQLEIELRCREKADELLDKYFPNFIRDAAVTRPETLTDEYNNELPGRVAAEFRTWLAGLWEEVRSEGQGSFEEIMNMRRSIDVTEVAYAPYLDKARKDAKTVTLWEKLTKTNHDDVTYYKGLLKQYTEELLNVMIQDFTNDIVE